MKRSGKRKPRNTARALIAAGRKVFARRGYDGASVRAITDAAGANLGAITYHFGNKRGLYNAVVASSIEPFANRVEQIGLSGGEPLDRLAEVVRAYFEHLWSNPDLPFLMMQELAAGRLPPPAAQLGLTRLIGAIMGLVVQGQVEGTIRAGEPQLLALSVVAQPVHLTVVRRATLTLVGLDQDDPETRARLIAHVVEFVARGLRSDRVYGAARGRGSRTKRRARSDREDADRAPPGPRRAAG